MHNNYGNNSYLESTRINKNFRNYGNLIYLFCQYLNIIILLALVYFSYITWGNTDYYNMWAITLSTVSLILLGYHILMFRPFQYKYWEFRTWFVLLSYLFMFGRVYLHGFNLDSNMYWNLSLYYSERAMYRAGLIILCSLHALFIGLSSYKRQPIKNKNCSTSLKNSCSGSINKLVFQVGVLLVGTTLPFRLFQDIKAIMETQSIGSYLALTGTVGLTDDVAALFTPGIVYMIAGINGMKRNNKGSRIILQGSIIYFVIVMVLTGDRRYQTTAIIAICLCYVYLNGHKITFRKILVFVIIGILFLEILTTISSIRLGNLTSITNFIVYFIQRNREDSIIYTVLSGFGVTFFSVVAIVETIPSTISYQCGLSFYGAIPSLLPIGWLFGDFFRRVDISNIVNSITGHPVGASLIGESFANFEMLSIPFLIFVGVVFSKIFQLGDEQSGTLSVAKYYSLFYIAINLVRGAFIESFRGLFVVYFVPLILLGLLKEIEKRKIPKEHESEGIKPLKGKKDC